MRNLTIALLLMTPLMVPQGGQCQMVEGLSVRGAAAGMGAGVAASGNHGQLLTRTYESALQAQQRALAETKAIEQYVKLGSLYEGKKQWDAAEKSFNNALQVIAQRDGVGSEKAVPVLKHLVTVTTADHDFAQAISYQKTVLLFAQAQAAKMPDPVAVISEQITLANLYAQKQDYASAEPILQASMATTRSDAVTQEQRIIIRSTYARILRQLHKDAEADALEKSQQMPEPTIDEQLPVPVASDNKATAATVSGAPTGAHAHALKKQADDSPVSVQDLTGAELNNALISVDQFFALTGLTPQSLAAMGGSIASSSASLVPTQAAAVAAVRAGVTLVPPSEVTTTASGLAYSRVTQTFSGTVTVMNIGSSAIIGPLQIVINGLPVTVTTMNATGKFAGTPYLTVPTTGLAPGQSVTASVQFSNPSNAAIELTPSIYSGSVQ